MRFLIFYALLALATFGAWYVLAPYFAENVGEKVNKARDNFNGKMEENENEKL